MAEKTRKNECPTEANIYAQNDPIIGLSQSISQQLSLIPSLQISKYFLENRDKQSSNDKPSIEPILSRRIFVIEENTNQSSHDKNDCKTDELKNMTLKIDDLYKHSKNEIQFEQVVNLFDPFRFFKYELATDCKIQNISAGWIKLWEILTEFNLVPSSLFGESFISFHAGAYPETSIFALNHYVKTKTNLKSHVWFASAERKADDPYELKSRYPAHWIYRMGSKIEDQTEALNGAKFGHMFTIKLSTYFNDKIHLYISDGGLDPDEHVDREIKYQSKLLNEIVNAFSILKKGGNMTIKLYSFSDTRTQVLISLCVRHFRKAFITKPLSSKIFDPESYLVCVGFDLEILADQTLSFDDLGKFDGTVVASVIPHISESLSSAQEQIYNNTIVSLKQATELFEAVNSSEELKRLRQDAGPIHRLISSAWVKLYPIKQLKARDRLSCKED
jgi:FtsJ-like methyltransferase